MLRIYIFSDPDHGNTYVHKHVKLTSTARTRTHHFFL